MPRIDRIAPSRREHFTPSLRELGWPTTDGRIAERDIATVRHLTCPDAPGPSCCVPSGGPSGGCAAEGIGAGNRGAKQ